MKKFALALIACFALTQSAQAATSALTESLLEYEAITNAIGTDPAFENVIGATEFITDIRRITRRVNVLGTVRYEIVTRVPSSNNHKKCHHHRNRHPRTNIYLAVLNVAANPGIGPNIVTVVSITPVQTQTRAFVQPDLDAIEALN